MDSEFDDTKKIFEQEGFEITVASKGVSKALGKLGSIVKVDIDIDKVEVKDYDAIIFIGGSGARIYFNDPVALVIAKEAVEQGKILAAICVSPAILGNAGVLQKKKATIFPSAVYLLRGKAEYTGKAVEVDGNIITANGPRAAKAFAKKIVELIG